MPDDEAEWRLLAKRYGVRLPPYGLPCTTAGFRRFLRALGVKTKDYMAWDADKTLDGFAQRNPGAPLKQWAGLILEAIDDGHLERSRC